MPRCLRWNLLAFCTSRYPLVVSQEALERFQRLKEEQEIVKRKVEITEEDQKILSSYETQLKALDSLFFRVRGSVSDFRKCLAGALLWLGSLT